MFYKELKNIEQAILNNVFPDNIVDKQIKRAIKNCNQQNKHCNYQPNKHAFTKLFTITRHATIIN